MNILYGVIYVMYGIVFGSFYNVVIYRLPINLSIVKRRSFCPACRTKLAARDLIPVFSQLSLKNRCRYCHGKIAIRYPLIELFTGFLFLLSYCLYGLGWDMFKSVILWSMLLITAVIDYDHMVIMDGVLALFSGFMIICRILAGLSVTDILLGGITGFGLYLVVYILAGFVYRKEAFGFGDVLLMGSVGLFFRWDKTIIAAILSFYIALAAVAIRKLLGEKIRKKDEIPFGPFICIAAFITSIYGEWVITFIKTLIYT